MPQNNDIAKLLDMEGVETEKIENRENEIILTFRMERKIHTCPQCASLTDRIHDYRMQRVKDLPVQGKKLIWQYKKRRYVCAVCGKKFYEKNYLLPKRHQITNRTAMYCLNLLKQRVSQKDVAENLGVSPSTVNRWLSLVNFARPKNPPKVLSIDEFKGNAGGEKFQCILTDAKNKRVIDILPTRKQTDVTAYMLKFENRNEVEYVVMDMNRSYFEMARELFGKATIVIDKFHVVRYNTWAFENVRKRVQKQLLPHDRKYFKKSRRLLLKRMSELSDENRLAVERMLSYSADLQKAYLLKEYFYSFAESKDSRQAREWLKWFRIQAELSGLNEYRACLTMLNNWEKYILNAFDCTYSNGYTEGINNSIKVIKRTGFGYTNFENFRRRIMLVHSQ